MEPGVLLVISLIVGAICAAIASSKGRSSVGWFFGGFFLGLIGIILVSVLPNLKEQERIRKHAMAERRRLKEQLRQEKMKTESFRHHATGRLDTHDAALGLDTRQATALGRGAGAPNALASGGTAPPPLPAAGVEPAWYYEKEGESQGPVPQSTIVWMLENGALAGGALVWSEGQTDWVPASTVPEFGDAAGGVG